MVTISASLECDFRFNQSPNESGSFSLNLFNDSGCCRLSGILALNLCQHAIHISIFWMDDFDI
ncbi:hypothetical protein [Pantoea agglomerans]|uniref:Uncharacterized protein n=1 Tax=Enterobacter agglomerans TaxID=549 RepID=A0ACC5PWF3_ENTAG|nr:hypothetical protein [Pantoea agglomerans]MBD8129037.1 hypothetical protein [Pantoea agglomerans]MBD8155004.1 hypothetical protein [Pantoea agglomerans]